jgi:hypothetical protein
MEKGYQKLFRELPDIEAPKDFRDHILLLIKRQERRLARIRLAFFGPAVLFSLVASVPSFEYALQEFGQSNFYQYFSLIFSDGRAILPYWREFIFSLAESLPFLGLLFMLITVFAFLSFLLLAVKNARSAFSRIQFIS